MTSVLRCVACGVFVQPEDRFCWSCGTGLTRAPDGGQGPAPTPRGDWDLDPQTALVMRRAYLAQQRGQLEEAERLVREVLDDEPDSVPALSMLAGILRRKGDLVGSVAAAQRVSEVTVEADAPPGTIEQAREERAKIEEHVVRELGRLPREVHSPAAVFTSPGFPWYRSRHLYIALTSMGAIALFLAVVAILRGQLSGYVWFGISLFAAGWCYNDAESRREAGILWGPFVLCLGPFGLAIYLLATH